MKARTLAQYMLPLQKKGGLTWDREGRSDVNGKEDGVAELMGHKMPTKDVAGWD